MLRSMHSAHSMQPKCGLVCWAGRVFRIARMAHDNDHHDHDDKDDQDNDNEDDDITV